MSLFCAEVVSGLDRLWVKSQDEACIMRRGTVLRAPKAERVMAQPMALAACWTRQLFCSSLLEELKESKIGLGSDKPGVPGPQFNPVMCGQSYLVSLPSQWHQSRSQACVSLVHVSVGLGHGSEIAGLLFSASEALDSHLLILLTSCPSLTFAAETAAW